MNWSNKWVAPANVIALGIEKTTFHFQDGNKRRSIDVTIVGDLALDYDNDGWNIYHVPTGACFTKAVPPKSPIAYSISEIQNDNKDKAYEYEPSELLTWMKKVQEKHETA